MKNNRWVRERYGSRMGLFLSLWYRMWFLTGRFQSYRHIDWSNVDRLVFVCKGNVCRSPFAEYLARAKGLNSISCGTVAGSEVPANDVAIAAALRKGVDLSGHKSRSAASIKPGKGDLFVVMEPEQGAFIKARFGNQAVCTLLGIWQRGPNPYLHDPYGNLPEYFDRCFDVIEKSVEGILREIKQIKQH